MLTRMNTAFFLPQPRRLRHVRHNFVDLGNMLVKQILELQGSQHGDHRILRRSRTASSSIGTSHTFPSLY